MTNPALWVLLLLTIITVGSIYPLFKALRTIDNYLTDRGHPNELTATYSFFATNIVANVLATAGLFVLFAVTTIPVTAKLAMALTVAVISLTLGTRGSSECFRIKRLVEEV